MLIEYASFNSLPFAQHVRWLHIYSIVLLELGESQQSDVDPQGAPVDVGVNVL